jgi:glycine hydroxymethyltransferase
MENPVLDDNAIRKVDPEIADAISKERIRQTNTLELIASENIVGPAVMAAQACVMTNKYAEGYPGKRYYGGCENVDIAESLAIERAKKLFDADYANVQPHSGSQANMAVYFALLSHGDTVLGMDLSHGGHLTHGAAASFSGRFYHFVPYGVSKDTGTIDYDRLAALAKEHRPKMIVAGGSAYPRFLDFEAFKTIAKSVGAFLMVDMAHIAGLIAGGVHPSPIKHADIVTSTTHKTLRGPRGGLILAPETLGAKLNKEIFPGIQGGPLMHVIAAKAVAFKLALADSFKAYQRQVVKNAATLAAFLMDNGIQLMSGGTDNHLMLVDLRNLNITGKDAEHLLEQAGITVNKNTIAFDTQSPFITSGIRIGTPAVTTRGMKEAEMKQIGGFIIDVLKHPHDDAVISRVKKDVHEMCAGFPLFPNEG